MNIHKSVCPGCGIILYSEKQGLDADFNASASCQELYLQLSYYTLSLHDVTFIHQLIVDTYAAQHYFSKMKPITITFALVGLYLVCERSFSGKQVQNVHIQLAKKSKIWPVFSIPKEKAIITVQDVLQVADEEKNTMIQKWNSSVWEIWASQKHIIESLLTKYMII